ncbi:MAG: S9 family peptidase [Planctomycetota bacterium]|nr:S9 family peptidase [Planctomycetota bacterium]
MSYRVRLFCLSLLLSGCHTMHDPTPPDAPERPVRTTTHGDVRIDEYAWIREKENPEVIEYLERENTYADARMSHTAELQETLYEEMLGRIKEDDTDVPWRKNGYLYYDRTEEGRPYRIICRRKGTMDAPEEILLDVNERTGEGGYINVTAPTVSPDGRRFAWLEDTSGYERCDLYVKDLDTGEIVESSLHELSPWSLAWGSDNETLFYTRQDETNRPDRVYRHRIGTDPSADELVFHEPDGRYFVGIDRSRSGDWLVLGIGSKITSEYHVLAADEPWGEFEVVAPRRQGIEYSVEQSGDTFYILTNEDAMNFKVVAAPTSSPGIEHWSELVPHDEDVYILGVDAFRDHLVLSQRRDGYRELKVIDLRDGSSRVLELPERVSTVRPNVNAEFDTDVYRFGYTSMTTPSSIYEEHLDTGERSLLKQDEVLGDFDASDYVARRITATSGDGTEIPISIVHRRGIEPDGTNPVLLYGYGSYGSSMDPRFSSARISLLDRGVVFAMGHIRGGSEMGRHWYEDGKFLKKRNTFDDFIACAETLRDTGWAHPDRIAIEGASAGGLLIGATINMRPELFCAAHAGVPFVDVMNTMLDPSIPLTVIEYEEWGNPNDPVYYDYMKSYSPYDNVTAQAYPNLLITAGLNDPRVHYWEPAKWTARMRDLATGDSMLLLKTNMGAGHGGSSGRYDYLREIAFEFAFMLDHLNATEVIDGDR